MHCIYPISLFSHLSAGIYIKNLLCTESKVSSLLSFHSSHLSCLYTSRGVWGKSRRFWWCSAIERTYPISLVPFHELINSIYNSTSDACFPRYIQFGNFYKTVSIEYNWHREWVRTGRPLLIWLFVLFCKLTLGRCCVRSKSSDRIRRYITILGTMSMSLTEGRWYCACHSTTVPSPHISGPRPAWATRPVHFLCAWIHYCMHEIIM